MRRCFAPAVARLMAAPTALTAVRHSSLSDTLNSELQGEKARDDLPTEPAIPAGWTVTYVGDQQVFTLSKAFKGEQITIESSFYNEAVNPEGNAENVGSMELTISNPAKNEALVCALDVEEEELVLDSIMHVSDYGKYTKLSGEERSKLYGGPEISELDQQVVGNFVGYLEERGVNDEIAKFVLDYSNFREQKEYENWLTKVSKFTE